MKRVLNVCLGLTIAGVLVSMTFVRTGNAKQGEEYFDPQYIGALNCESDNRCTSTYVAPRRLGLKKIIYTLLRRNTDATCYMTLHLGTTRIAVGATRTVLTQDIEFSRPILVGEQESIRMQIDSDAASVERCAANMSLFFVQL